jgi:ankyrin repeat protein
LDKNYNPNEQNNLGDTPLHYAIQLKNKNIIQLLMNDGGDLNIQNKKGISPFDLADRELRSKFKFTS